MSRKINSESDTASEGPSTLSRTADDIALDPPNLDDFPSDPVMIREFVDGAKDLKVPKAWLPNGDSANPTTKPIVGRDEKKSGSPNGRSVKYRRGTVEMKSVPRSRKAVINGAIRLYKVVHSDVKVADVNEVIEEVMGWGQALISAELESETEILKQLVRHDEEVLALNAVIEDKSDALLQMESTIGMLNKYVRQLEARLQSAGLSLDSANDGASSAVNFEEQGVDVEQKQNQPPSRRPPPPPPQQQGARTSFDSLISLSAPTTPQSTATAYTTATSPLPSESNDIYSIISEKMPEGSRIVYERLVESSNKCADARGALEIAKNHLQLKKAMAKTSSKYQKADAEISKAEKEVAKAFHDLEESKKLFVMLGARLAAVSARKETEDIEKIEHEIEIARAQASLRKSKPNARKLATGSKNKNPAPDSNNKATDNEAIFAPGGVNISQLLETINVQEQSTATDSDTDAEIDDTADDVKRREIEDDRLRNVKDAKEKARNDIAKRVTSPKKVVSPHHVADRFTGTHAGMQVIVELYRHLQKENINLVKEQEQMDVNNDGLLDLEDMIECCSILGIKLPMKKATALFDHLRKMEVATGNNNSKDVPDETISLEHFIDTLTDAPPTLSLWHSRAIGGSALREQKKKRVSLLTQVYENEHRGSGNHSISSRQNIALGEMATDPNTHKSREVHEFKESLREGWNHDFSGHVSEKLQRRRKNKEGFGNIFEAIHTHHNGGFNPNERRSSIMVDATHDLATSVGKHTERTLLKIGLYCKRYNVNIWEVFAPYDQFGDGYIEETDLKKALNDLGLNITVAESKLVYKAYLRPGSKESHGRIKIQDLHDGICKYLLSYEMRQKAMRQQTLSRADS